MNGHQRWFLHCVAFIGLCVTCSLTPATISHQLLFFDRSFMKELECNGLLHPGPLRSNIEAIMKPFALELFPFLYISNGEPTFLKLCNISEQYINNNALFWFSKHCMYFDLCHVNNFGKKLSFKRLCLWSEHGK